MLGSWLQDLAAEQAEPDRNGVPPFVVPDVVEKEHPDDDDWWARSAQAVWDDVTVLTPWALYRASGDVDLLRRQFDSMKMWLDRGVVRGKDGLWTESLWQLGDWFDPNAPPDDPINGRTDGTLVANSYLVHVTEIVSRVSEVLGYYHDAERYALDYAKL